MAAEKHARIDQSQVSSVIHQEVSVALVVSALVTESGTASSAFPKLCALKDVLKPKSYQSISYRLLQLHFSPITPLLTLLCDH